MQAEEAALAEANDALRDQAGCRGVLTVWAYQPGGGRERVQAEGGTVSEQAW